MEKDDCDHHPGDILPEFAPILFVGRTGKVARNQDEQGHVEYIDQPHDGMIDNIDVVKGGDNVTHDHKHDQKSLQ